MYCDLLIFSKDRVVITVVEGQSSVRFVPREPVLRRTDVCVDCDGMRTKVAGSIFSRNCSADISEAGNANNKTSGNHLI